MTDLPVPIVAADDDGDDPKSGVDLRKNGSVHLWIDGNRTKLRVVRVRDYRKLRRAYDELNEAINEASRDATRWSTDMITTLRARAEAEENAEMTPEEEAEENRRMEALADLTEGEMLTWWRTCIALLGDQEMDEGELPAWMADIHSPIPLINHWRTVPQLSGVQ